MANGRQRDNYNDGTLKEEGNYKNSKEEGLWKSYYPNGQLKLLSTYKSGELTDSAFKYYSSGKVKEKVFIKGDKIVSDPKFEKIQKIYDKGVAAEKDGDHKTAIKNYTKCLEIDSAYAEAYFGRGTAKLHNFQFNDAITDFDKAISIEPYYIEALGNRAFSRIRKYQFTNSRTLSANKDISVLATKDNVAVPAEEKQKICDDLHKTVFLGDKSKMIKQAIMDYCQDSTLSNPPLK